jgi:hypothetical protein
LDRGALVALGLAVGVAVVARDAGACMCVRHTALLLAPNRENDAPLNTRVRVDIIRYRLFEIAGARLSLRAVGGAEVATTMRGPLPAKGLSTIAELVPRAPLEPRTRYEVAFVVPGQVPEALVFGMFTTGTTSDTTPPVLDTMGSFTVGGLPPPPNQSVIVTSSCGGDTPHVVIEGVASHDPARPGAQLLYGAWIGTDTTRPPDGIFPANDGRLVVGAASTCELDFDFPKVKSTMLSIAAIDEAGNASAPRKLKIDLVHP